MLTISYKNLMRAACFIIAVLLSMLGLIIVNAAKAEGYRARLENSVVRSLREAAGGMNALSADLKRSSYAGTPAQLAGLSAKVLKKSGEVKSALQELPAGIGGLEATNKFLAQVGDYSMYLSRRASNGETPAAGELDAAMRLVEYSELLTGSLSELERMVDSGEISASDLLGQNGMFSAGTAEISSLDGLDKSFDGYPSLIYDGPFSDSLLTREPEMTMDLPRVSRETARETAGKFAGSDPSGLLSGGDEASAMPSYTFYDGGVTIGVTMDGGLVTYLSRPRMPGKSVLSVPEALQKARAFLEKHGMTGMEETYYDYAGGILTINFAYSSGGVICYTDLIKVGVAMDNGEILFYDARGFITNHRERGPLLAAVAPESAQKSVNKSLDVKSSRLTLIPGHGKSELLAWEFLCADINGGRALVYINAKTGAEERILILIESENGTLVI